MHDAQLLAHIFVGKVGVDAPAVEQIDPVLQILLLLGQLGQHDAIFLDQIGRASCRERVCQYVKISVVVGALKKKQQNLETTTHKIKHNKLQQNTIHQDP